MSNPNVKPKILVIDDDPMIRSAIQTGLSRKGYIVAGAKTSDEALRLLADVRGYSHSGPRPCPYDLILLDIQLGEMSGIDLLKVIRTNLEMTVPVLMISGMADSQHVNQAAEFRIAGFVVKPFTANTLEEKIVMCLRLVRQA